MLSRIFSASITITMCWCMLLQPLAIRPASPPQESQPAPGLRIVILEGGDGAINNLKTTTAREVVVEVQDEHRRPVAGAVVTLKLPFEGPGGNLVQGGKIAEAVTDSNGRATLSFVPSREGQFRVELNATSHGQTAARSFVQTNKYITRILGMSPKVFAIVASAAAGGTTAAVVATTRSSGATISAGSGTVTAPR